jgi:hypothetical protein
VACTVPEIELRGKVEYARHAQSTLCDGAQLADVNVAMIPNDRTLRAISLSYQAVDESVVKQLQKGWK